MRVVKFPKREEWFELCKRPVMDTSKLEGTVKAIMQKVKLEGDSALFELTEKFDKVKLDTLKVTAEHINAASDKLSQELKEAIQLAKSNIERFHASQREEVKVIETQPGVECWRKSLPIEKVGLYIPGGSAPLFSTLLMLGIPAKLAGCKEIVVCTPAGKEGIHPAVLYTAQLIGIENIYQVGGAQAVAAMAHGTESITKIDKIFGPGNQYVTMAKQLSQQEGAAIDMPAGPSEVLVIADDTCVPEFVAADLLSQAEHGADSQVVLVLKGSDELLENILEEVQRQVELLPRKEVAKSALEKSLAVMVETWDDAMDFSNRYAPEHLILAIDNAEKLMDKVSNAGSVFIGNWSCESAGDYASGTNHTLPTNAYARNYSGVSLDSFMKKVTFQKLNRTGIQNIGPAIEQMAEAEGLQAHKNAVTLRLNSLKDV